MKTFASLAAAILLLCSFAFAQSSIKGKITGEVQETTSKPLPFATVLLLHAKDSTLAKGAISSETGHYEFENIATGQYLVSATTWVTAKPFLVLLTSTKVKTALLFQRSR
ncbi:MAG: carboxypeptidase-like regulatory domain-containing protein [Spirosomataceae bacterium]